MKKMLYVALCAFALQAVAAVGSAAPISRLPGEWRSDYGAALAATKKSNRPLLVVLYDSRQAEQVSNSAAAEAERQAKELSPYELCRVDVSTAYGQATAKSFGAKSFPHTAVIDKTGSVILYDKSGDQSAQEWSAMLVRYRSGERVNVSNSTGFEPQGSYCPSCRRK